MGSRQRNYGQNQHEKKSHETLRLLKKRQEITKPGNFWFKFVCNLNRKLWVPRRSEKRGRDDVTSIDLGLLFKDKQENRPGGGYFEFNQTKANTSTEKNNHDPENVSSNEESRVVRPTANLPFADIKKLRHRQENNTLYLRKSPNREAGDKKN